MRHIILAALLLTAALTVTAVANPERSFGVVDRLPGEDPSCEEVNRAYERTSNASNYVIYLDEWQSDGVAVPYIEEWLAPAKRFLVYAIDGMSWTYERRVRSTVVNGLPRFRACLFQKQVQSVYGNARHYSAKWSRGKSETVADIWISVDTGKFLQVTGKFTDTTTPFPFNQSVEVYRYPGDHGPDPKSQAAIIPLESNLPPGGASDAVPIGSEREER